MKILLVTFAIGEKYLKEYESLFKNSHVNYANKCGYDFKVIDDYLALDNDDKHPSNICMNKFLLCSQEWSMQYDFIVYVDADILININSPPIHTCTNYDTYIGVIDEYTQPSKERRLSLQQRMGWESSASEYYKLSGFDIQTDMVFNGGVLVFQPRQHKDFLQSVYDRHIKLSKNHQRGFHYEQSCTGYEIQKANLYKVLDNRFDAIWTLIKLENCNASLENYFMENYFIHFTGHCDFDRIEWLHNTFNLV